MLRAKFWFGLKDPLLRNACRHKYDTVKYFDTLRREIRAIELDTPTVQRNSISVESQKLTEVLKKIDAFNKRIDSMEAELRELKVKDDSKQSSSARGSYNQGFSRGKPRGRWNSQGQNRNQGQYDQGQNLNGAYKYRNYHYLPKLPNKLPKLPIMLPKLPLIWQKMMVFIRKNDFFHNVLL